MILCYHLMRWLPVALLCFIYIIISLLIILNGVTGNRYIERLSSRKYYGLLSNLSSNYYKNPNLPETLYQKSLRKFNNVPRLDVITPSPIQATTSSLLFPVSSAPASASASASASSSSSSSSSLSSLSASSLPPLSHREDKHFDINDLLKKDLDRIAKESTAKLVTPTVNLFRLGPKNYNREKSQTNGHVAGINLLVINTSYSSTTTTDSSISEPLMPITRSPETFGLAPRIPPRSDNIDDNTYYPYLNRPISIIGGNTNNYPKVIVDHHRPNIIEHNTIVRPPEKSDFLDISNFPRPVNRNITTPLIKTNNDLDATNTNINEQDRFDYDYSNQHNYIYTNNNNNNNQNHNNNNRTINEDDNKEYRLTTERLAYILIGSCCALSVLCLIIVAFSIRCRDMCDEYKAWKKAEKLASLNYRYQSARRVGGAHGNNSINSDNFFSHRNTKENNSVYPPIRTTRPIFGPSCCCCPNPGTSSGWSSRNAESCPKGYFHPCPRGKLPFGAASSIQAFPRNHVITNHSDEDDSLGVSLAVDSHQQQQQQHQQQPSDKNDNHPNSQCTCIDQQQHQHIDRHALRKHRITHGERQTNPSWLQSSIIVDELHRKHSQFVRDQRMNSRDDQRFIFLSQNRDRLI